MVSKWSIRVDDKNPQHTRVSFFNHGGFSGTLVINTDDVADLIDRLTTPLRLDKADLVELLKTMADALAWTLKSGEDRHTMAVLADTLDREGYGISADYLRIKHRKENMALQAAWAAGFTETLEYNDD